MVRRALIAVAIAGAGILIWALLSSPEPEARQIANAPEAVAADEPHVAEEEELEPVQPDEGAEEESGDDAPLPAEPRKLDPKSDAFIERIDDQIPNRIYQTAARECWEPGLPSHQKIKLEMRIHAIDGEVFVTGDTVLVNTIEDERISRCIIGAVHNARWRDEEMPDWEDDDELTIRLGGMKKHLDVQDNSEEGDGARHPMWNESDPDFADLQEFERRKSGS